jgi:hypothetical protein
MTYFPEGNFGSGDSKYIFCVITLSGWGRFWEGEIGSFQKGNPEFLGWDDCWLLADPPPLGTKRL